MSIIAIGIMHMEPDDKQTYIRDLVPTPTHNKLVVQVAEAIAVQGVGDDWQAVVDDMRQRHFRKKGFIAGFEDIVSGAPKHVEPHFLAWAKARWLKK